MIVCVCCFLIGGGCYCDSIQFIVWVYGGFLKRLYVFVIKNFGKNVIGFFLGLFGVFLRCEIFEIVVFVGVFIGVSFIVLFLEDMVVKSDDICVKRVELVFLVKIFQEIEYYV